MSRHNPPVDVPCGVCLTRITGWTEVGDEWVAQPCGHDLDQIDAEAAGVRRVRFGQYAEAGR